MTHRLLVLERMAMIAIAALVALPALAQSDAAKAAKPSPSKKYTAPRTPDGHPDLQGIWSNAIITPLERPSELEGKQFLSEEEASAYAKQVVDRNDVDHRERLTKENDVARAYNEAWYDRGTKTAKTRRTSLIVDPPDGRIPQLTAAAEKRMADLAEARRLHPADGPEDRTLGERCILMNNEGPPMVPGPYNNNYQIVQTPKSVIIFNEMIHDARTIPLDGRPHLPPTVRQWRGDSVGHWEGDALVVDTTNFTDRANFRGSGKDLHLTERFTRVDADTLMYQFTVDDPASFAKPWTVVIPSTKTEGPIFEYACNEGNYGMLGILSAARAEEKAADKNAKRDSR